MRIFLLARRCPKCKSRHVRRSRHRRVWEKLLGLLTIRPYRCHACNTRFHAWWGWERRSVPRLTRVMLRLLAGATVIVISFWLPVRFFGITTGAVMGVALWVGTALVMGS
jgi:transposase-like protein